MAQKGVVFSTELSLAECAEVFRQGASDTRGVGVKLSETIAKVQGNGDQLGFYTPTFDSPFAAIDGVPDFAVGHNFMGPMHGARGAGIPVHMYVDECHDHRDVQLVSKHGLTGGPRAARLTRKVFSYFQDADPELSVGESNI